MYTSNFRNTRANIGLEVWGDEEDGKEKYLLERTVQRVKKDAEFMKVR